MANKKHGGTVIRGGGKAEPSNGCSTRPCFAQFQPTFPSHPSQIWIHPQIKSFIMSNLQDQILPGNNLKDTPRGCLNQSLQQVKPNQVDNRVWPHHLFGFYMFDRSKSFISLGPHRGPFLSASPQSALFEIHVHWTCVCFTHFILSSDIPLYGAHVPADNTWLIPTF